MSAQLAIQPEGCVCGNGLSGGIFSETVAFLAKDLSGGIFSETV